MECWVKELENQKFNDANIAQEILLQSTFGNKNEWKRHGKRGKVLESRNKNEQENILKLVQEIQKNKKKENNNYVNQKNIFLL